MEKTIDISIKDTYDAYVEAGCKGICLLVDPNGNASFLINGEEQLLSQILKDAFERNKQFLILVLATVAAKASGDKELRELLPILLKQINLVAEDPEKAEEIFKMFEK